MADELIQVCEQALLLFSYTLLRSSASQAEVLDQKLNSLFHSLLEKSDYVAILKTYQRYFHFNVEGGLSITFENDAEYTDSPLRKLEVLVCGIAALQAFLQANWTGPAVDLDTRDLFTLAQQPAEATGHKVQNGQTSTVPESDSSGASQKAAYTEEQVNAKCVEELSIAGEPAYHLTKKAGYLLLAKTIFHSELLNDPKLPSIAIWKLRFGLANLRLLDTPVPLPQELIGSVDEYTSSLPQSLSTELDLKTSLLLLQGVYHAQFVHISSAATKISNEYFYSAAKVAKLNYELTGRMGKRTKWQIDEKSQLVVLAKSRDDRDDGWKPREKMDTTQTLSTSGSDQTVDEAGSTMAVSLSVPSTDGSKDQPRALLLNDDTLLERTQFTSSVGDDADGASGLTALSNIDPNHQPVLHPLDECILLTLSLGITNNSPAHGLTTMQIQSFVNRVLEDGSQNWSVYSMGLLLRSRLEANRSRTVERGLLQIQSLVDQLKLESISKPKNENDLDLEKGASPYERLKYFFQLSLPSTWELEKELATRYLGLGVVRSAMEIFTRLEMWEEVAKCHSAVGDDNKAIQIVKDLLDEKILESESTMSSRRVNGITEASAEESPPKPAVLSRGQKVKLWCLLGDLERDTAHYETAWQISNETSSRAMQSIGRSYFMKGDYAKAEECLSKALAINPLNGKLWFILGCSAMRNESWKAAETAFRRCTAIDDDDGESWNNLATVILKQVESAPLSNGTSEDPTSDSRERAYDNKRLATTCLKQAIRYSYDSWRIWVNYLTVSVEVGELMEACRAMGRLAELRADKDGSNAVDLDVLDKLVQVVVEEAATAKLGGESVTKGSEGEDSHHKSHRDKSADFFVLELDKDRGLAGRVKSLFENALLPRITSSSHIYTSYARLLFALDDLQGSVQAHLKAYRVDVVQNDLVSISKEEFEKASTRVQETVEVMRNLGDREVPGLNGETVLPNWRTQARSMVRTFLGRTKEAFGEENSWEYLQEELQSLKA